MLSGISPQPVELAFVFLIIGFVADYRLRAAISQFRRAEAGQTGTPRQRARGAGVPRG